MSIGIGEGAENPQLPGCDNIEADLPPHAQNRFDIPGYPGYQATNDGEIIKLRNGRPKRQRKTKTGAMRVDIGKSSRMVHDLVARAFHGHPLVPGYRVIHASGDPSDNRESNLLWSGSPRPDRAEAPTQSPTTPLEIERELERIETERLELIDLMQP